MKTAVTIIVAIIGSGAFTTIVQYLISQHLKDNESEALMKKTLAAVAYGVLSNELERLLTKGFATPDERRSLGVLFNAYKANGWNGDMDARMKKVYESPTDRVHKKRKSDIND